VKVAGAVWPRQEDEGADVEEDTPAFPFGGRKLEGAATVAERQARGVALILVPDTALGRDGPVPVGRCCGQRARRVQRSGCATRSEPARHAP
jgi:hypothetical protein